MNKGSMTLSGHINGKLATEITVNISQEQIDVTSQFKPNPDWQYVDKKGHFHAYTEDKDATNYPTLKRVHVHEGCDLGGTATSCPESDECNGDWSSQLECTICSEIITPSVSMNGQREYMAGLKSWNVSAAGVWAEPDEVVSIRLNKPSGDAWLFGVAMCTRMHHNSSNDVFSAEFDGIGPLAQRGRRKVTRG